MLYKKIFIKLIPFVYRWIFISIGLQLVGCATKPSKPVIPIKKPQIIEPTKPDFVPRPLTHRVVQGEGLYSIALKYRIDFRIIADWNGIAPPYNIYPGQILRLSPDAPINTTHSPRWSRKKGKIKSEVLNPKKVPNEGPLPSDHTANNWIWPTQGRVVQTFIQNKRTRKGIRIVGSPGQEIIAASSGKVIYSGGGLPGYGKLIIIKHAKNYLSVYGFNNKIFVHEGTFVTQGKRIAEMGYSTDGKPMLHFEIRRGETALNPIRLLPKN